VKKLKSVQWSVKASHPSMAVFDIAMIKKKKKEKKGEKKDNQTGHGRALVVATRALEY